MEPFFSVVVDPRSAGFDRDEDAMSFLFWVEHAVKNKKSAPEYACYHADLGRNAVEINWAGANFIALLTSLSTKGPTVERFHSPFYGLVLSASCQSKPLQGEAATSVGKVAWEYARTALSLGRIACGKDSAV